MSTACVLCGQPGRPYPAGSFCPACRPFPAQPTPDPDRTLRALRIKAGINPDSYFVGRTVFDDRAETSGKRVSATRRATARGPIGGQEQEGGIDQ